MLLSQIDGVFFLESILSVPPFQNFPTGQPAKYYTKYKIKQFKSHNCPLTYEHRHLGVGIPGYISSRGLPFLAHFIN